MGFFSQLPCFFDPEFSCLSFQLKEVFFSCRCNKQGSFVLVRTMVSKYGRTTHCVSHLVSVSRPFFRNRLRALAMQGFDSSCYARSECTENSHKGNYDK